MSAFGVGEQRSVQRERRLRQRRQRPEHRLPALDGGVASEPEQATQRRTALRHAGQRGDVDAVPDPAHLRGVERHGAGVDREQPVDDTLRRLERRPGGLLREPEQERHP